jgi:drug/metabolite transporter (DMT)-like permease
MGGGLSHTGEAAAVLTALLWSFTAIFFTLGTRRVGALAVNLVRLSLAVFLLGTTHCLLTGVILPPGTGWERWGWLGISGVVGLSVGDSFLFAALDTLGPRKSMLLMATSPILTAVLGLALFGEVLSLAQVTGIFLTVAGVAWVVLKRENHGVGQPKERLFFGVLMGLGGSVCQSLGLLAAKKGMAGGFPALDATLLRMVAACAALWLAVALRGKMRRTFAVLREDPGALLFIGAGGVTGPYLGVWMSLFAVAHAKVGVAATLMALVPVFLIPITRVAFGERATWRAVGGTGAAFAGSALLFWS